MKFVNFCIRKMCFRWMRLKRKCSVLHLTIHVGDLNSIPYIACEVLFFCYVLFYACYICIDFFFNWVFNFNIVQHLHKNKI